MQPSSSSSVSVEHYSIFCGVFMYKDFEPSPGAFIDWRRRLNAPVEFIAHVKKLYYENYFANIYIDHQEGKSSEFNTILHHETSKELLEKPIVFSLKETGDQLFQITWFDRYIFSDGLGIFSFKVEHITQASTSYSIIASLIKALRNPGCEIILDRTVTSINAFIKEMILPGLLLPTDWDKHFSSLKNFTMVNDLKAETFTEDLEKILFELAHAMPMGSVGSQNIHSPTRDYYNKVYAESSIGVFGNWKAIPLLDSFTRLSTQFSDTFRSWEQEYLQIYIGCLYFKYQLINFNDQWKAASQSKKNAVLLKDQFVSFLSNHSSPSISYKFLPNLLFEKMNDALEIKKVKDMVESKMNRITEVAESKANVLKESDRPTRGSVIFPGFDHDIFISFRQNDNKLGWVSEFVDQLKDELAATLKQPVSISFDRYREESADGNPKEWIQEGKLNCPIIIPIISHTYSDPNGIAWHELLNFNQKARASDWGRDIALENGNVTSRILPVCIHELDDEDKILFAEELGMALRTVDFIYREPGVNRPLKPDDDAKLNLSKTSYRNQINKLANVIKEVVKGIQKMN
jgi:hypothetical protein